MIEISRDKLKTARFLARHDLPVPRTEDIETFLVRPEDWQWPVILKPKGGSSSVGIHVLNKVEELQSLASLSGECIAQEYKIGKEYTVNIYLDNSGKPSSLARTKYNTINFAVLSIKKSIGKYKGEIKTLIQLPEHLMKK